MNGKEELSIKRGEDVCSINLPEFTPGEYYVDFGDLTCE